MSNDTRAASVASFHPVDRDRWPDLVRLFEHHGNPGYCWCMRWRVPSGEFNSLKKEGRQAALSSRVTAGEPIGILGYVEGEPVGWCSIAPRTSYAALERSRVLKRLDDQPVWAVVCFFLDRRVRGRGFARDLLQAAVAFARAQGATIVEGYPAEPGATSYRWMGSLATFQAAGFHEVSPVGSGRRIMRYVVDQTG
ncbi:MAG: GNAT family N-acetyltransferase [Chloroflexota bacterium]